MSEREELVKKYKAEIYRRQSVADTVVFLGGIAAVAAFVYWVTPKIYDQVPDIPQMVLNNEANPLWGVPLPIASDEAEVKTMAIADSNFSENALLRKFKVRNSEDWVGVVKPGKVITFTNYVVGPLYDTGLLDPSAYETTIDGKKYGLWAPVAVDADIYKRDRDVQLPLIGVNTVYVRKIDLTAANPTPVDFSVKH